MFCGHENAIPTRALVLVVPLFLGCFDHPDDKVADMVCATDENCPRGYRCIRPGVVGGCSKQNPNTDGGLPSVDGSFDADGGETSATDAMSSLDSNDRLDTGRTFLDASDTPMAMVDAPDDVSGNPVDVNTGSVQDVPQASPIDSGRDVSRDWDGPVASGGTTGSSSTSGTGGASGAGGISAGGGVSSTGGSGGLTGSGGSAGTGGLSSAGGSGGTAFCVLGVSPVDQCVLAP